MMITLTAISVVFLFLTGVNGKETLRFGALISQHGLGSFYTGFIPAMDLALETIENDTTLPFRFEYTLNDSMVRRVAHELWHVVDSRPL